MLESSMSSSGRASGRLSGRSHSGRTEELYRMGSEKLLFQKFTSPQPRDRDRSPSINKNSARIMNLKRPNRDIVEVMESEAKERKLRNEQKKKAQ